MKWKLLALLKELESSKKTFWTRNTPEKTRKKNKKGLCFCLLYFPYIRVFRVQNFKLDSQRIQNLLPFYPFHLWFLSS